jgi:hypothetical protein
MEAGAVADGRSLASIPIQEAIDGLARRGGGRVVIPAGTFRTGMLRLRSGIELHLAAGARLLASAEPEDHRPWTSSTRGGDHWHHPEEGAWHLVLAEDCHDIAITGPGTLDGNGAEHYNPPPPGRPGWPLARHKDGRRPGALVQLSNCRGATIRDCRLTNVANWTLHLFDCDDCRIRDIRIRNPQNAPNADGIDLTGCHNVTVSGCHIDTCDDAVCLKTLPWSRTCEHIVVTGCILRTHCAALKLGSTESFQDMRNIVFADCVVTGSHRAVGLYSSEGAWLENISISNIVCDTRAPLMFTRPIHVDVRQQTPGSRRGGVRNLRVDGLLAETNGRCLLTAADGCRIEQVLLRDILLRYPVVDDPQPLAEEHGGGQFSVHSPWARCARAAFVAENVDALEVSGLKVRWPDAGTPPHPDWAPAHKLANGGHRVFEPAHWQCRPDTPFAAVALRGCPDARIDTAGLTGWQGGEVSPD